jgi:hypothetical protein
MKHPEGKAAWLLLKRAHSAACRPAWLSTMRVEGLNLACTSALGRKFPLHTCWNDVREIGHQGSTPARELQPSEELKRRAASTAAERGRFQCPAPHRSPCAGTFHAHLTLTDEGVNEIRREEAEKPRESAASENIFSTCTHIVGSARGGGKAASPLPHQRAGAKQLFTRPRKLP